MVLSIVVCGMREKKKGQNQLCFVKLGKKRKGKTNGDEGNCKEKSRTKQLWKKKLSFQLLFVGIGRKKQWQNQVQRCWKEIKEITSKEWRKNNCEEKDLLKQILAKASHRSQKNKKFLLCVANKKEGLHFANFSKSWKAFRVLSLLFPSADFVHPSVSQGFALLCFLIKCLLSCKLLYFREKKNFFSSPKRKHFWRVAYFSYLLPTVLFSCTIFLVSGPWSILFKNSYALCFFFLKEISLVCKIKQKKNKWTNTEQRIVFLLLSTKKKAKDFHFRGKLKEKGDCYFSFQDKLKALFLLCLGKCQRANIGERQLTNLGWIKINCSRNCALWNGKKKPIVLPIALRAMVK